MSPKSILRVTGLLTVVVSALMLTGCPEITEELYVLDPEVLHDIAKQGVGLAPEQMFATVHQALQEQYPGLIADEFNWHFNVAGGAMGQLTILYASVNEYLIFFGSPIGTEGYSGRYSMEVYDFMMDGEMWCFTEGQFDRTEFLAGDAAYLDSGEAKGYRIPDHAWMLEYARGNIPASFEFGVVAPARYVTLDWDTAWAQIFDYINLALETGFPEEEAKALLESLESEAAE